MTSASLLTTLVSDDPVYVYFDADEQTYLKLREGQARPCRALVASSDVYIGLVDEDGYPHQGSSTSSTTRSMPTTGTIRARAALANPDGRYTPGLFARVRLIGGEDHDAVLIEDRAVGTDLSKKFVLTLTKDNRIEYRLVELGPEIDGLRVVTQGLAPNELVVVNGLQHVRPGQSVAATRVSMSDAAGGLTQVAAARPDEDSEPASGAIAASPVDAVSRLAQAAARSSRGALVMKLSQFFISRPIFAGVLSALIFLAGLIALPQASDQRVSGSRAADGDREGNLSGRKPQGHRRDGRESRSSRRSTVSRACCISPRRRPPTAS